MPPQRNAPVDIRSGPDHRDNPRNAAPRTLTSPPHPDSSDDPSARSKFAYLLLTHARPQQVEDLGERILQLSPHADIVVHHDASAPDLPWEGQSIPRIHFVDRENVLWGGWSMVDATERLLRFSVENLASEWFVLLSADHRPAMDLTAWEEAVVRAPIDAYLPAERLSGRMRFGRGDADKNLYLARGRHRWTLITRPKSSGLDRGIGGLMKLSQWIRPIVSLEFVHRREAWAIGIRRRTRALNGLTFYRGSQWIALNRRAALAALDVEPQLREWFTRSWIPDETYFHTVLRTAGLRVSNDPTTFVLEPPAQPTAGWMQLTLADLPAVWKSQTPFARKVDLASRPEVATTIDEVVDGERLGTTRDTAAEVPRDPSRP